MRSAKFEHWIDVLHVVLGEDIVFLGECGLDGFRRCGHGWTGIGADNLHQRRGQHVVHREEDDVQRLLAMLLLDQVVDVRNTDFRREAGVDGAAAGAGPVQIGARVIGVDDVLRLHTQTLQISVEERCVGVDVQHAGNADAKLLAILHERNALFGRLVPELRCRDRVCHALRVHRPEDLAGRDVHEVGMFLFDFVEAGFDVLHVVDIFDQALFAGRDDQPLLPMHQRDLGDLLNGNEGHVILGNGADVDECAQAIVLAEIAAGGLVAGRSILDFPHCIQSDERGPLPFLPKAQRFDRSADGSGFAAEFMDDDLRFLAGRPETVVNEIHFGLYHRHIVLSATLQNETRAQRCEIRNTGHVQEHILGKDRGQTRKDLLRPPTLALEIHDVRLHEDSTTVTEHRHRLSGECQIGVLLHAQSKTFGSRLQEVAISRRTLGVEFEVFDPAIVQDDDLDVLPTHVDDDVRIFVKLERRLGVRHGLDQRHIGVQDVFQDILCVARGGDSQDFQLRLLRFDLTTQILKHFNRVLDRITIGELVRLAEDVAVLVQQHGLGGGRASVDADEPADYLIDAERGGYKSLAADREHLIHRRIGGLVVSPLTDFHGIAAAIGSTNCAGTLLPSLPQPSGPHEIVLGERTLRALRLRVGQDVAVTANSRTSTMRVVGAAVLAAFSVGGGSATDLGYGAVVSASVLSTPNPPACITRATCYNFFLLRYRPGTDLASRPAASNVTLPAPDAHPACAS